MKFYFPQSLRKQATGIKPLKSKYSMARQNERKARPGEIINEFNI